MLISRMKGGFGGSAGTSYTYGAGNYPIKGNRI